MAAYEWSLKIEYNSYEKLTCREPYHGVDIDGVPNYHSIEIAHSRPQDNSIRNNLDEIRANFDTHGEPWLASQECREIVEPLLSQSTRKIRKIVAFALGSMARADSEAVPRWTIQHALVLGIADALHKTYGYEISCFSQEPLYTDDDKTFLDEKKITVLEDPMGFLEVNEETLVISIAPNVCVKEILADLTRPAVMMWDEVVAPNPAENEWATKMIDGELTLCPYVQILFLHRSSFFAIDFQEGFCRFDLEAR